MIFSFKNIKIEKNPCSKQYKKLNIICYCKFLKLKIRFWKKQKRFSLIRHWNCFLNLKIKSFRYIFIINSLKKILFYKKKIFAFITIFHFCFTVFFSRRLHSTFFKIQLSPTFSEYLSSSCIWVLHRNLFRKLFPEGKRNEAGRPWGLKNFELKCTTSFLAQSFPAWVVIRNLSGIAFELKRIHESDLRRVSELSQCFYLIEAWTKVDCIKSRTCTKRKIM